MNSFGALVGAFYLTIGAAVKMGFCMTKFTLPFAAFLFALAVDLQLVDVTNRSCVWKVLAIQIFTAVRTLVLNPHRVFQALLAEDLATAACLLGLLGNQSANEADVVITWVTDKLIVISAFKSVF